MASCKLIIEDEVNIKIEGLDVDVRRQLANALKFEVPYAKHMPQYKLDAGTAKLLSLASAAAVTLIILM
jgi:hypothetical protein